MRKHRDTFDCLQEATPSLGKPYCASHAISSAQHRQTTPAIDVRHAVQRARPETLAHPMSCMNAAHKWFLSAPNFGFQTRAMDHLRYSDTRALARNGELSVWSCPGIQELLKVGPDTCLPWLLTLRFGRFPSGTHSMIDGCGVLSTS